MSFTIRLTTMIKIPTYISLSRRINEQVIFKRHEIEMLVVLLSVLLATSFKLTQSDYLTNILDKKRISLIIFKDSYLLY